MLQLMPINTTDDDPVEWAGARPCLLVERLPPELVIGAAFDGHCEALRGAMTPRTLEQVALRVSAVLACPYAWSGHVRIALRDVLSYEEIAGVAYGPEAFAGLDAAVLTAVDELLFEGQLTSATTALLGEHERSVTLATGAYQVVTWVMRDVDPEPEVLQVAGLESPERARATYVRLRRRDFDHCDHHEAA